MKKIAVLTIALVLLASAAAFASPLTASGEFTYGGIANSDFNRQAWGNAYVDFTLKVDDINTVVYSIAFSEDDTLGVPGSIDTLIAPPTTSKFRLATDLGKALNLSGVALTMYSGWFSSNDKDYAEVGGYNNQDLTDSIGLKANAGFMFDLGIGGLVNIVYGQDFHLGATNQAKIGAYSVMGPLSWEAWYALDGFAAADADIGVGLKVALGSLLGGSMVLDLGGSFVDNLGTSTWGWGIGAKVGLGMVTGYVGVNGDNTDFLNGVGIAVNLAPLANVGIDAGVFLDTFSGAADTFNSADLSVYYKAGASTVRVGYLISSLTNDITGNNTIVALNAPTTIEKGGFYASWDIDF